MVIKRSCVIVLLFYCGLYNAYVLGTIKTVCGFCGYEKHLNRLKTALTTDKRVVTLWYVLINCTVVE